MAITRDTLIELYRSLLRIRRIEEALAERYQEQEMRCPMHLCIGQEAAPVGVCQALRASDSVYSNHRAHGHYLAKGGDLRRFVAEIYGRATGCSGGFGGSMHLIDKEAGFMGCTPIVGGTVPLAVGAAWAGVLKKTDDVAVAFFGDGCFEEGVMHECLNFAALKRLPVLFVCENNRYSVFTPLKDRQPDRPMHEVAKAHGWTTWAGDGNDTVAVYESAQKAVASARKKEGPQFLEFSTYRWREHCGPNYDDRLSYREESELRSWKERCPVRMLQQRLLKEKVFMDEDIQKIEHRIANEIEEAFRFALSSPKPSPNNLSDKVYAS